MKERATMGERELKKELKKFEAFWQRFRPNDAFTPNGDKTYAWLGWQQRARESNYAKANDR